MHPWGPEAPVRPRLALSLRILGREVDQAWPDRSRESDGWIGDSAHAARDSDHNPDAHGLVHAIDVTAKGIQPWDLVIAAVCHPSTSYVIFRGRIFSRSHLFLGRKYTGPDDHRSHVHVSILQTSTSEAHRRRWLTAP